MADVPAALFRRWMHVHEDDEAHTRVYRPAEHPLPPARGRDGIEFRADGTYVTVQPGPADAPVISEPHGWTSVAPGRLRLHDAAGHASALFEIVDVTDEVLRLRPVAR